jgi:hypothetical protein
MGIGMGLRNLSQAPADSVNNSFELFCGPQGCVPCSSGLSSCLQSLGLSEMNPIAFLESDNNGWVLDTPNEEATLTLGIGTRENNTPEANVHVHPINTGGLTPVQVNGKVLQTIFDTGTAFWSFPMQLDIPEASLNSAVWFYNPPNPVNISAQILNLDQSPDQEGDFTIPVLPLAANSSSPLYPGLASSFLDNSPTIAQQIFLAGFPFFIGRKVYYGISGSKTPLGTGPFNAF